MRVQQQYTAGTAVLFDTVGTAIIRAAVCVIQQKVYLHDALSASCSMIRARNLYHYYGGWLIDTAVLVLVGTSDITRYCRIIINWEYRTISRYCCTAVCKFHPCGFISSLKHNRSAATPYR